MPRRARITFSDTAAKQFEAITTESAVHALDRAVVAISVDPGIGAMLPGQPDATGPQLREYADDIEQVRVVCYVTVLRTVGRRAVT
ncbi:hypothetical protein [Streptomyces sp. NPDC008150]|uniref:hypothetical protein n=1 Tax=Streptomyces sp. NPDC008150 TaxID=3364816 RepID=UPI0036E7EFCB